MQRIIRFTLSLTLVFGLLLGTGYFLSAQQQRQRPQQAQGNRQRPQMDPEQMLQRMLERALENFDASEEELQVLKPRVEALLRTRTAQGREIFSLTQELRTAVDSGDEAQIRAKLDALKAKRKEHESKLKDLEADLVGLLTLKQEAQLTLAGIVNGGEAGGFGRFGGFGGGLGGNRQNRRTGQPGQ